MRKLWCPYSQSCNLVRAAENDGGQEVCVHDMRKLWCPYYQSCILVGPVSKKVGPWDHVHLAQFPHSVDDLPQKSRHCGVIL